VEFWPSVSIVVYGLSEANKWRENFFVENK
jgi:hypothetical protein